MSRKRTWTDEQFVEAAKTVLSASGVLRALGLSEAGANHVTVKNTVKRLGIDTSHWLGQAHLRGKTHAWTVRLPMDAILVEGSSYVNTSSLKGRMLREGLLKNECVVCGQGPEWKDKPLVMVLDHVNGVYDDHRMENLRLLCPNCNSQQETFCRGLKSRHSDDDIVTAVARYGTRKASEVLGLSMSRVRQVVRKKRPVYPNWQQGTVSKTVGESP